MREKMRFRNIVVFAVISIGCFGCSNSGPDDALDQFQARKAKAEEKFSMQPMGGATTEQMPKCRAPDFAFTDIAPADSTCTDGTANGLGTYLGVVDTTVAPGTPLLFRVEITETNGTRMMTLNPLHKDTGMVIAQDIKFEVKVSDNGTFRAETGDISVVGLANAISGSDIRANLVLAGQIRNDDYLCGAVAGCLLVPFTYDLIGSTFTMTRVADDTALAALFESTKADRALSCTACSDSPSMPMAGVPVETGGTSSMGGDVAGGSSSVPTGGMMSMGGTMIAGGTMSPGGSASGGTDSAGGAIPGGAVTGGTAEVLGGANAGGANAGGANAGGANAGGANAGGANGQ